MRWVSPQFLPSVALLAAVAPLRVSDPFVSRREQMVRDQIEGRGVRNSRILQVLRATPRHEFIPAELWMQAYDDYPLPIGFGATISQPYIVALMTEMLAPAKQHRVLEIGTGSGYQAAVLAQLAKQVYTIEIVPELAESARRTLHRLGYDNVTVREGDGYRGWPECAPFDRIILTAAPPEVPKALLDQLAPGGRMVAPVGPLFRQELELLEKTSNGSIRRSTTLPVSFVPMRSK
jgi:protein-L-isoaspartate(D-aspartate) O-methyltransferase